MTATSPDVCGRGPNRPNAPLRWMAGADSVANAKSKARDLIAQADAHLELSTNLDH